MFYDFIVWENTNLNQITHSQTSFSSQMTKQSKSNKSHIFSWKYFSFVSPQQLELSLTNIKLSIIFSSEPGLMFVRQSSFYWTQQWWDMGSTLSVLNLYTGELLLPQILNYWQTTISWKEKFEYFLHLPMNKFFFETSTHLDLHTWLFFGKRILFYLSWFIVFTLQYQFPDVCI